MNYRAIGLMRRVRPEGQLRRQFCTKDNVERVAEKSSSGVGESMENVEEIEDFSAFSAIGGMGVAAFGAVGLAAVGAVGAFQMASWAAKEAGYNLNKKEEATSKPTPTE